MVQLILLMEQNVTGKPFRYQLAIQAGGKGVVFPHKKSHWHFNLPQINRRRLSRAIVLPVLVKIVAEFKELVFSFDLGQVDKVLEAGSLLSMLRKNVQALSIHQLRSDVRAEIEVATADHREVDAKG